MFDLGIGELLLIGIVALIVVGPRDLPGMFHTLGRFTARARQMGREFSRAMEEAAQESGMKETANTLKQMSNPKKMGLDALNDAADKFEKWETGKSKPAAKPDNTPEQENTIAMPEAEAELSSEPDEEPMQEKPKGSGA